MIIAVNSRFIKDDDNIMNATLNQLVQKYPEHKFLFIFNKLSHADESFPANVEPIITGAETSSNLRLQYWLNYKLPRLLKKNKADILLSLDGACSMRTKKPQCLLVNDLNFLNEGQAKKNWLTRFYKKHTPAFLAKAKSIVTVSDHLKKALVEKYKVKETSIDIIKPGIDPIFKPLDWEEKEKAKDKYAGGKAYFLFNGPINENSNLINLLKAFTFFKKRQKSNMLLLIAGKANESFKKEFKNYRLKDEVRLLEDLSQPELAEITAAAYAIVHPVIYSGFALSPFQAMQCEVPVVSSRIEPLISLYSNAAIYADATDFKDIAEHMMLVYKDEGRAKEVIAAGCLLAKQYQPDDTADQLMQSILRAFNN